MTTAQLKLPELAAAQNQKHVTVNTALGQIDALFNLNVIRADFTGPPGSPTELDRYIVAATATGAWAGQETNVALYYNATWVFVEPEDGWLCYDRNTNTLLTFNGTAWVTDLLTTAVLTGGTVTQLGVNTTPSSTNRLAVKSDQILFSHDDVTPGTGSCGVVVNKDASGDDAGQTFQTGFSTRAILGLLADDNFTIKVSDDGAAFTDALVVQDDASKAEWDVPSHIVAQSPNNAHMGFHVLEEELTGLSGATATTSIQIPNGAIVFNVSVRVTTTITGATSYDVGDGTTVGKFGGTLGLAAGSTNFGVIGPTAYYSNTSIVLTANGSNFTAGAVRVAIHYYMPQVPQS